jgi:hypothetical protein
VADVAPHALEVVGHLVVLAAHVKRASTRLGFSTERHACA